MATERLLNHRDQKFRLRYVLGPPIQQDEAINDDWTYEGDSVAEDSKGESLSEIISQEDQRTKRVVLERFAQKTKDLANTAIEFLVAELAIDVKSLNLSQCLPSDEIFRLEISTTKTQRREEELISPTQSRPLRLLFRSSFPLLSSVGI